MSACAALRPNSAALTCLRPRGHSGPHANAYRSWMHPEDVPAADVRALLEAHPDVTEGKARRVLLIRALHRWDKRPRP